MLSLIRGKALIMRRIRSKQKDKNLLLPFRSRTLSEPLYLSWFLISSKFLIVISLIVILAGCSINQLTPNFATNWFGSSKQQKVQNKQPLSEDSLLAAAKEDLTTGDVADLVGRCPAFKIWQKDQYLTVYNIGQVGDGLAVRHRGEITKTARECQILGTSVHVKYGFSGRVLLGPKGQPGLITLPAKIYLSDKTGQQIKIEKISVSINMEPGKPIGFFSMVREINIPIEAGKSANSYKLFVGFEQPADGVS